MSSNPSETTRISLFDRQDKLMLLGGFLTMLVSGAILFFDIQILDYAYAANEDQEPIARLVNSYKSVKRRPSQTPFWERVGRDEVFYQRDQVYTQAGASARIEFTKLDAFVEIGENSLVVINIQEDEQGFGGLFAAAEAKPKLSLKIDGVEININKGTKIKVEERKDGESQVQVLEGKVSLTSEKGKVVELSENEVSTVSKETITKPKLLPMRLVEPKDDYATYMDLAKGKRLPLEWKADPSIKNFQLEISQDPGFKTKQVLQTQRPNYAFSPKSHGTFYWRVGSKPQDSDDLIYSVARRFTLIKNNALTPFNPRKGNHLSYMLILEDPDDEDSEKIGSIEPIFDWQQIEEEGSYHLQIAKDPGFKNLLFDEDDIDSPPIKPLELQKGTIYWRVRFVREAGPSSPWSQVQDVGIQPIDLPKAPSQLTAKMEDRDAILSWQGRAATSYEVQISESDDFDEDETITHSVLGTQFRYKLTSDAKVFYRIKTKDSAGRHTAFSKPISLQPQLKIGKLVSPPDKSQFIIQNHDDPLRVNFSWTRVNLAKEYVIEIAKDPSFDDIETEEDITTNSYNWKPEGAGWFYWRIRVPTATKDLVSELQSIKVVDVSSLEIPLLVSPQPGSEFEINLDKVKDIEFSWAPVKGAQKYVVEVYDDTGVPKPILAKTLDSTQISLPIKAKGQYKWRVGALYAAVSVPKFGEAMNFSVNPFRILKPPQALGPNKDGLIVISSQETDVPLTWQGINQAGSYQVLLATSPDFKDPIFNEEIDTHTTMVHLNTGTYYWKLAAIDKKNRMGGFGPVQHFTIHQAPKAPELALLGEEEVKYYTHPPKVTFAWKPHGKAAAFGVEVSKDPAFETIEHQDNTKSQKYSKNLEEGVYYVRVRHQDLKNIWSPWSDGVKVAIQYVPILIAPTQELPDNNFSLLLKSKAVKAEFQWSAIEGATSYTWQLASAKDFKNILREHSFNEPQSDINLGTLPEGDYHWRVQAVDDHNRPGKWSGSKSIKLAALSMSKQDNQDLFSSPPPGTFPKTYQAALSGGAGIYNYAINTGDNSTDTFDTLSRIEIRGDYYLWGSGIALEALLALTSYTVIGDSEDQVTSITANDNIYGVSYGLDWGPFRLQPVAGVGFIDFVKFEIDDSGDSTPVLFDLTTFYSGSRFLTHLYKDWIFDSKGHVYLFPETSDADIRDYRLFDGKGGLTHRPLGNQLQVGYFYKHVRRTLHLNIEGQTEQTTLDHIENLGLIELGYYY